MIDRASTHCMCWWDLENNGPMGGPVLSEQAVDRCGRRLRELRLNLEVKFDLTPRHLFGVARRWPSYSPQLCTELEDTFARQRSEMRWSRGIADQALIEHALAANPSPEFIILLVSDDRGFGSFVRLLGMHGYRVGNVYRQKPIPNCHFAIPSSLVLGRHAQQRMAPPKLVRHCRQETTKRGIRVAEYAFVSTKLLPRT